MSTTEINYYLKGLLKNNEIFNNKKLGSALKVLGFKRVKGANDRRGYWIKKISNMENLKTIPLYEFCISRLGYQIDKEKDSRNWRVLIAPSGEKILTRSVANANGHYLYKSVDSDHAGSLIDLLINVHNYDMAQIKELEGVEVFTPVSLKPRQKKEKKPASTPKEIPTISIDKTPKVNYLTKKGISLETMKHFNVGASYNTCFFPLWARKNYKFFKQTAIEYYSNAFDKSYKKFLGERAGQYQF